MHYRRISGEFITSIFRIFATVNINWLTHFLCLYLDWNKIIDKIEKGERKKTRLQDVKDMIQEKIERHLESVYHIMYPELSKGTLPKELLKKHSPMDLLMYSWSTMQFKYAHAPRGWTYRQEEDAFLLTMMHRHGYGAARRIQLEIRRAWQFRFDWFFKSRSPQEIQKRCDILIKIVEKELEELHEKEEKEMKAEAELETFSKPVDETNGTDKVVVEEKPAVIEAGVTSDETNVTPEPKPEDVQSQGDSMKIDVTADKIQSN